MLNRLTVATFCALLAGLFAVSSANAAGPDRPATPPPTDYWQNLGFLNMAHQGGELEAPGNTLYAFKTAMKYRGADTLEMDGYVTEDNVFVVTHDMDPYKTSNAPNDIDHQIRNMTLAELKQLDFGYWFSPGKGQYGHDEADPHPYRGIATGDKEPPTGYTADDFKIPTFEEVLAAFPHTPLNIDMKTFGPDPDAHLRAAEALAKIMKAHPERSDDVIVASFSQEAMEKFHELAPNHKALSGSLDATLSYIQGTALEPTPVALQPPDIYNLPPVLRTVPVLKPFADYDGFAIHVWGSDNDPAQESDSFYAKLIAEGADGFFTQEPGKLHQYLCEAGIRRPDGTQRCSSQAPDPVPETFCPEGTIGAPPLCGPPAAEPFARLSLRGLSMTKRVKTGQKIKFPLLIQNAGDEVMTGVKVCFSVHKSKRKKVKLPRCSKARNVNPLYEGSGNGGQNPVYTGRLKAKRAGKVKITAKVTTANGGTRKISRKVKIKPKQKCKQKGRGSGGSFCGNSTHF